MLELYQKYHNVFSCKFSPLFFFLFFAMAIITNSHSGGTNLETSSLIMSRKNIALFIYKSVNKS